MSIREHILGTSRLVIGTALVASLCLPPQVALAKKDGVADFQQQASTMLDTIEMKAQEYQDATVEIAELETQIAENEATASDLATRLPEQRERTAASIRSLYKLQQSTPDILSVIFSAEDFNDFVSALHYFDAIHRHSTAEIQALSDLESEFAQTQALLVAERDAAAQKQQDALKALEDAYAARNELQSQALQLAQANADGGEEVLSVVQQAVEASNVAAGSLPSESIQQAVTSSVTAGNEPAPQAATPAPTAPEAAAQPSAPAPTSTPVATPTTTATSGDTQDWAARIDSYLAGSPLAGHGADFAAAAEQYGVDPRISPAIATMESGKGQVCFRDHNAWGWGQASWSDWSSAINGHVSGFSQIYGSDLTLEGAKMYASNDIYDQWYNMVQNEMSKI